MTTAIFSITNPSRERLNEFAAYIVEKDLKRFIKSLIGCYKGAEEPRFCMDIDMFNEHVKPSGFVTGQESYLTVTRCAQHYTTLVYFDEDMPDEGLGRMVEVSEQRAKMEDAWSYDPTQDMYFICVPIRNGGTGHGE